MEWSEVKIYTTTLGTHYITGILLNLGIQGSIIKDANDFNTFLNDDNKKWDYIDETLLNLNREECCVCVYIAKNAQGGETLLQLKQNISLLKKDDIENSFGRLEIELTEVKDEDWENNWKQFFKPFFVGEKFIIKPSWENIKDTASRNVLEIDPGSSFGTGQHHTTQLCIKALETYIHKGDRVLDLGCGSGILGIAALLLGACDVTAVDIDENAVRITKESFIKNKFNNFTAYCGDIIKNEKLRKTIGSGYNVVIANIVADVIIAMSDLFKLFLDKNGILIISGIIDIRRDDVIECITDKFNIIDIKEQETWLMLALRGESK